VVDKYYLEKNQVERKRKTKENQPNRQRRSTEETPTICKETRERLGTHKKQKNMCNHQALPEILNWVGSSKLDPFQEFWVFDFT